MGTIITVTTIGRRSERQAESRRRGFWELELAGTGLVREVVEEGRTERWRSGDG